MIIVHNLTFTQAVKAARRHNERHHAGRGIARQLPDRDTDECHLPPFAMVCLICDKPEEDTWESLGRGFVEHEPDQTYGADSGER